MLYINIDDYKTVRDTVLNKVGSLLEQGALSLETACEFVSMMFDLDDKLTSEVEIFKKVRDEIEEGRYI